MLTAHVISGIKITVDISPGSTALTIYDEAGQLPRALEQPVVRRTRAILADLMPFARVIVRFPDAVYRSETNMVRLVSAAVRRALEESNAQAA